MCSRVPGRQTRGPDPIRAMDPERDRDQCDYKIARGARPPRSRAPAGPKRRLQHAPADSHRRHSRRHRPLQIGHRATAPVGLCQFGASADRRIYRPDTAISAQVDRDLRLLNPAFWNHSFVCNSCRACHQKCHLARSAVGASSALATYSCTAVLRSTGARARGRTQRRKRTKKAPHVWLSGVQWWEGIAQIQAHLRAFLRHLLRISRRLHAFTVRGVPKAAHAIHSWGAGSQRNGRSQCLGGMTMRRFCRPTHE